ncbi:uncharacterized protein LOC34617640 [Cyclospora cayetanensis]|uniref:Uncharacterized protein LOC34617640 n=1 Tax=Cyclospora cayetanensis TaxID=88456 RepID=A0A6P6RWU7_9EIME|nr:uncharacterized protein LOC34617640 [Cyclospora cayetanensis]
MRLTVDLILQSPQYISPSKNWTLGLRGCQVDVIENLGATADHFECIDLSDNEIIKLQNFPPLNRLTSLIVCNNRVSRIASDLFECLPNVVSLVLTNNRLERLSDLEPLFKGRFSMHPTTTRVASHVLLIVFPLISVFCLFPALYRLARSELHLSVLSKETGTSGFNGEPRLLDPRHVPLNPACQDLRDCKVFVCAFWVLISLSTSATPRQPPQTGVTTAPTVASEARGLKPQQLEAIKVCWCADGRVLFRFYGFFMNMSAQSNTFFVSLETGRHLIWDSDGIVPDGSIFNGSPPLPTPAHPASLLLRTPQTRCYALLVFAGMFASRKR